MAKSKKPAAAKTTPPAVAAKPRARAAAAGKHYRVNKDGSITRLADGACIPHDPANADFAAFVRETEADPSIAD